MPSPPDNTPVTYGELRRVVKDIMEFVGQSVVDAPHEAGTIEQLKILRRKRREFVQRNPEVSPTLPEVDAIRITALPDYVPDPD